MLPKVLIGLFALELATCIVVGIHMFGDEVAARRGELALCIALYLLVVRLLAVLASFLYAARHDTPAQSPLAWLRTVLEEYAVTLLAFSVLIPLSFVFAPRLSPNAARGRAVVVLVHGLLSNRGVWWLFARRLRREGLLVDSLDLVPTFGDLDRYVDQLDRHIEQLARHAPTRLVLVGHSMGGLVCRAWLARRGGGCVSRLVTLGSPHGGSRTARFLPGPNLRQMRPRSDWLLALPALLPVPAIALYSAHDNLVVPFALGRCEGIESEEWRGLGHLSLLFDHRVFERARQLIVA
mgnify:CR=1 FL=1